MSLLDRAAELSLARIPYVQATVVRAVHPTSAHAGDVALVHADGQIEGFVGGTCAESSVRLYALEVLVSGEPLLLRVIGGAAGTVVEPGSVTVANPCASGGTVEVFLEPRRPPDRLVVIGETPVSLVLSALAAPMGLAVELGGSLAFDGVAAVVVASHGRGEAEALQAALDACVPYVALVGSRVRAATVLAQLTGPDVGRVHSPAGLDLGGRTAAEIALAVLAELVQERCAARRQAPAVPAVDAVTAAVDPVCGMTVAVSAATPTATVDGLQAWFCCPPCLDAYQADPAAYPRAG